MEEQVSFQEQEYEYVCVKFKDYVKTIERRVGDLYREVLKTNRFFDTSLLDFNEADRFSHQMSNAQYFTVKAMELLKKIYASGEHYESLKLWGVNSFHIIVYLIDYSGYIQILLKPKIIYCSDEEFEECKKQFVQDYIACCDYVDEVVAKKSIDDINNDPGYQMYLKLKQKYENVSTTHQSIKTQDKIDTIDEDFAPI